MEPRISAAFLVCSSRNERRYELVFIVIVLLGMALMANLTSVAQSRKDTGMLFRVYDSAGSACGYRNKAGRMVIPLGRYSVCFTDTFRKYAIVIDSGKGIIGIDRRENVLYNVFVFENGPDYPSSGLFRIQGADKIGYADAVTGKVVINPQFACAWPFEHGLAQVALDCQTRHMGEYHTWVSNHWFYINKVGVRVKAGRDLRKNR